MTRRGLAIQAVAFALAAYALYWVAAIVAPQIYRPSFLLLALVLTFLSHQSRWRALDWTLIALAAASLGWAIAGGDAFIFRAATPSPPDLLLGSVLVLVVLEATRRTVGWVLPVTTIAFLGYAYAGPLLDRVGLSLIAHRGYSLERVIGVLYMTLEGILGVPLDVAATYIILFTIYGAALEHSGGGRFFVDWAMAAIGRSRAGSGPGRTVTLAGYLLGAVSGSGVANTVMLGAMSWPMMRRGGYPPDIAGGILAAAGIGAILAPPVMGAAAFLMAEFLNRTYFEIITFAAIPAALYYLSIVVTVEAESRRLGLRADEGGRERLGVVTRRGWYHFISVAAIFFFMARGVTAFQAVFWATLIAVAASFLSREHALWPKRLFAAIAAGGTGVVPVVATTAAAGIIVGIVTLTGLGLKAAGLIVTLAGDSLVLTVVYSALAVWMLGLAVPVTASYIIAAVMVAPALTAVGIAPMAAHMFVFYYAVLSEVSPPTALSPFAAAAVTGADPFRTTMLAWKYTIPAFVVPLVFTLDADGVALLMQGDAPEILRVTLLAAAGLTAIALAAGGYTFRRTSMLERTLLVAAGALLLVAI